MQNGNGVLNRPVWTCIITLGKGPSINDLGPFFRFYNPPPSPFVVFLLRKFRHFLRVGWILWVNFRLILTDKRDKNIQFILFLGNDYGLGDGFALEETASFLNRLPPNMFGE